MLKDSSISQMRRGSSRFAIDMVANALYVDHKNVKEICKVINISLDGLLLFTELPVSVGGRIKVELSLNGETALIDADVVWVKPAESGDGRYCGIKIMHFDENGADRLQALCDERAHVQDRRKSNQEQKFPLKRRNSDYVSKYMQSPFHSFLSSLLSLKTNFPSKKLRTVVYSKNLSYLQKRIRKILPEPRIIEAGEIDELLTEGTLAIVNIDCRRSHESFSLLDFDEYLFKRNARQDPLYTLKMISRMMDAGTKLTVASLGKFTNKRLAVKYMHAAKFTNVVFIDDHTVEAEKRTPLYLEFNRGLYHLNEVESSQDIGEIHDFASKIFPTEFNFSKQIDGLFTNQSDFYCIRDTRTSKLINFARVSWHLPGYFLPCMLAHKRASDFHLQLYNPDEISYGEVFSPYINSLSGAKTYGELVKVISSYGDRELMDVIFTTYDAIDVSAFKFFSNYFGFEHTGIILNYGDLGGDWNLIFCSKDSFQKNIKLKLLSTKEPLQNNLNKLSL